VLERLGAALATDEDRKLLGAYGDQRCEESTIYQEAAFLVGRELGRGASGSTTADDTTDQPNTGGRSVEDSMFHTISVLHLVDAVVTSQLGDVAEINPEAFYALGDLLEETAAGLEQAHGRYCTESNALHATAESGGGR
jgi:hypothetical protein